VSDTSTAPAEPARVRADLSSTAPAGSHWQEIDQLREAHRYFWNEEAQGYWVLTRYEDIREAFQTPEVFSNHSIVATNPDPAYRFLPSFTDPPIHMKYRHPMNPWFSPGSVAKLEPRLRELARAEVEAVAADGRCDYMATFADRFPVGGFLASMGLPMDDADFFVALVHRMSGASGGSPDAVANMTAAWAELAAYWSDMLADRRAHPLDPSVDFLTMMSNSKLGDEPMPDIDIVDIMVTLTLGSLDTLKSQLGWQMYHLGRSAEDRSRLVAEPELIPSAVEECLRAFPIVSMARKVTRDVDFHGCPMKKDDMVLLTIQAATRDPRVFPDPEQVRIDRSPNRHIAFGASEHRCIGSHLARAELRLAIEEWLRLLPEFEIDGSATLPAKGGQVALLELPLVWTPAASS
jgi:cytochrome P450